MSELLLGVDIGTSSTKGVLAQPDGEVVATAERPHDLDIPRPGWAEHDAEGVWWADFVSVCRELLEEADEGIAVVCTSGGDALLAARSVGLAKPDTDWSRISDTVEPEVENREIYDELYRIYRDLYPATREASHALADLQGGGGDVVA